jgi:hypothetical protein
MCCQSLLTVSASLHGSENAHEVAPHTPSLRAGGPGQSDGFEEHQPLGGAPFDQRCAWTEPRTAWVLVDGEGRGLGGFGSISIALDDPVKGRVTIC